MLHEKTTTEKTLALYLVLKYTKKERDNLKQTPKGVCLLSLCVGLHKIYLLSCQFVCWCAGRRQSRPTCSNKQDAGAEQDVVLVPIDASYPHTQATQHQQNGAENGEQA